MRVGAGSVAVAFAQICLSTTGIFDSAGNARSQLVSVELLPEVLDRAAADSTVGSSGRAHTRARER